MNKDFLKDVLAGRKNLMLKSEIQYIHVPHYEELSVKALYPELKKDGVFMCRTSLINTQPGRRRRGSISLIS